MKRSSSRRRSRSRSSSYDSSGSEHKGGITSAHHRLGERRKLGMRNKKSNFTSGFDEQPPAGVAQEATQQQMPSTAEILNNYRHQQSQSNFANHNKSERQLYIGNIPQNFTTQQLMELLNATLKEFGKSVSVSKISPRSLFPYQSNRLKCQYSTP